MRSLNRRKAHKAVSKKINRKLPKKKPQIKTKKMNHEKSNSNKSLFRPDPFVVQEQVQKPKQIQSNKLLLQEEHEEENKIKKRNPSTRNS